MSPNESETPKEGPAEERGPSGPALVDIGEFARIELKTGRVVAAEPHPDADRLVVMKVDVGEAVPRQIVAGILKDWEPDDLVGRTLVVVCNLKPARLRGVESQGMMLAVRGADRIWPVTIEGEAAPGTRVT